MLIYKYPWKVYYTVPSKENYTSSIERVSQVFSGRCFYKEPTPVSDLANNMRFRYNVLISVNCVLIKTDTYKNYYATFKREYWHASVHWFLLRLTVFQLLNKETVTRSRDVLLYLLVTAWRCESNVD